MTPGMALGIRCCWPIITVVRPAMAFCFSFVLFSCNIFSRLVAFYNSAAWGSSTLSHIIVMNYVECR
jgi:hypothetical protein